MGFLSGRLIAAAGVTLALAGLLVFGLAASGTVVGQETDVSPAPQSIAISVDDATPALGDAVTLSVLVVDADGNPLANEDCTFSIVSQPGTGASVDAGPAATDADGNATATLDVGSTAGAIEVEAQCGDVSATVSVVAGVTQQPTGAEPPASLPDTGSGGSSQAVGSVTMLLVTMLGALGVTLAGVGLFAARSGRRIRGE